MSDNTPMESDKTAGTEKIDRLSLSKFYSADAEALHIKYKQLEDLLGSGHHGPSEGGYCEALLKEFLRRTLPQRLSVDTGFIRRVSETDGREEEEIATPQLDIIVHDTNDYAPLLRSGDFVVVLPDAVRAVVEVKKLLDYSKLKEAVEKLGKTRNLMRKWRYLSGRVFTCIFAFALGQKLQPKSQLVSRSFQRLFRKTLEQFDGVCEAPDLVMALPTFALQREEGRVSQFYYCPTTLPGNKGPNIAGQFLVFLLNYYANWYKSGNTFPCPEILSSVRQKVFEI